MSLQIREDHVESEKGIIYNSTEWYEPFTDDLGRLYRSCVREYGRCTSKVYVDTADGKAKPVGWVFVKRVEYDDAHRISDPEKRTYLREVWVTYRTVADGEVAR